MKYGNYDSWKTATPWDDEPDYPEIFKADNYEYFTDDEKLIEEFHEAMLKCEYHVVQREYSDRNEYLEECAENISDDLGLYSKEQYCLESIGNKQYEQYLDACENGYKGKFKRRYK